MTTEPKTTENNDFKSPVFGTTAVLSDEPPPSGRPRSAFEVVNAILRYDVRSIDVPDQAWFWATDWQRMELEADEDIANGRTASFDSTDDFIADLDADD